MPIYNGQYFISIKASLNHRVNSRLCQFSYIHITTIVQCTFTCHECQARFQNTTEHSNIVHVATALGARLVGGQPSLQGPRASASGHIVVTISRKKLLLLTDNNKHISSQVLTCLARQTTVLFWLSCLSRCKPRQMCVFQVCTTSQDPATVKYYCMKFYSRQVSFRLTAYYNHQFISGP